MTVNAFSTGNSEVSHLFSSFPTVEHFKALRPYTIYKRNCKNDYKRGLQTILHRCTINVNIFLIFMVAVLVISVI